MIRIHFWANLNVEIGSTLNPNNIEALNVFLSSTSNVGPFLKGERLAQIGMFWTLVGAIIIAIILLSILPYAITAGLVVLVYVFRYIASALIGFILTLATVWYTNEHYGTFIPHSGDGVILLLFAGCTYAGYLITQAICPSEKYKARRQRKNVTNTSIPTNTTIKTLDENILPLENYVNTAKSIPDVQTESPIAKRALIAMLIILALSMVVFALVVVSSL